MPSPAVKPLAVLVVVGVLGAGCSGGEEPPGRVAGGLVGALGKIRATADTRVAVEYGEPARVRALGERFRALEGYGFGTIANTAALVDEALGVDPGSFGEAVVVGQPPRWGAVLWGDYDVDGVNDRLAGLGIDRSDRDGATVWTSGADFEMNLGDGPFAGVVQTNQFNTVRTAEGSFAYAPAAAGVGWVTDAGAGTLAGDDRIGGLAQCLGDVVAARIDERAAGVRADGTEVVCLDGDRSSLVEALGEPMPSTGQPWDEFLPGLTVEQDGDLVRVTAPGDGDEPAGRVLRAMTAGDLRTLG